MPQEKRLVEELLTAIGTLEASRGGGNEVLREALSNVQAMLAREDRGWEVFRGGTQQSDEGFSLQDLKEWSGKLREVTVGAPWIKRGFSLRSSYVWQGGIEYDGISSESRGGNNPRVKAKIDDPLNQRFFFGKEARRRREGLLYHDGIALWVGNDATKQIRPIPLEQITGTLTDPDYPGVIWAYRREWSQRQPNGQMKDITRWYFVDHFKEYAQDQITVDGKRQKVDRGSTAFDMHANSVEGWKFGAPDALAAWVWNSIARDLYMDGVDVSSAMATIAFKVNSASESAGRRAALQLATPQGAGGAAVMGAGTDLSVLASAGKGYDFSSVREVIALIATSISVSNIDLTSNPGDAGSSYGSAQTLEMPTRLAMLERREEHIGLDKRVLRWMGAPDATPFFKPLEDGTEQYRRLQAVTLPWLQGVITDEKYKELAADVLGVPSLGVTPDGMLLPNNQASLPRKDIDTDSGGTGSTAAPSQGRGTGVGDGASGRDLE